MSPKTLVQAAALALCAALGFGILASRGALPAGAQATSGSCMANQPPVASFVVEGGAPGQPATLRSTSTDPEGRPFNSVRWYSDAPGFPSGQGGDQITFTFPPGRHRVALVVRDDCDSMTTSEGFVEASAPVVTDGQAPPIGIAGGQKTVPVRRGAFVFTLNPFNEHVVCRFVFRTKHRVVLPRPRPRSGPSASARRRLNLGSRQLDLDAGEQARVRVKLSRAARAVLARDGKLRLLASIVATDDSGNRTTRAYPFTVKAKPRR